MLRGEESACKQETQVQSLGWEGSPEKELASRSSILAWEIPRTEEPGGQKGAQPSDQTINITELKKYFQHVSKRKKKSSSDINFLWEVFSVNIHFFVCCLVIQSYLTPLQLHGL